MKKLRLEEVSIDSLRHIAGIIGPSSAAAQALANVDERRRAGQDPHCYWTGSTFIIGPDLAAEPMT